MRNKFRVGTVLLLGSALALFAVACKSTNTSSNSSSNSAINMAGNWTLTTTSTEGHGTLSGTADVAQSGQDIGTNGATTLTAVVGSISVSQSGTSLNGTFTNPIKGVSYNFTGTLSGGNVTITGSPVPCSDGVGNTSINITGTITSTNMKGHYTTTRDSGCFYPADAGTWTATKQ